MALSTISNGQMVTQERKGSGIQSVFFEGRDLFWRGEDILSEKLTTRDDKAIVAGDTTEHRTPGETKDKSTDVIKDIRQTQHYPFVSFRRLWQGWADRTTFHGVNIIFNKDTWLIRRIFWLGLFIYMLVTLVSGCLVQVNRYLDYKTLTQENIFYEEKLLFPSVTICNYNQINNHSLHDERDRNILKYLYLYRSNKSSLADYASEDYTRNFSVRRTFMENALSVDDMFKSCSFDRKYYQNCSEILEGRMVGYLLCHTVNSESLSNPFVSTVVGSSYGLTIVLWANQDKYFLSESNTAGFKVLVHERGEEPNIEQALAVGPGLSHYLSIRKHERHYLTAPVKAFGNRGCLDTTADTFVNPLKYMGKYSYFGCQQECLNDHVYRICGCIGPTDIGPQRECNPFEIAECYNNAYINFKANHCQCAEPCHVTTYMTKMSSAYFPNTNFYKQMYDDNMINVTELHDFQETRENALLLKVFFDSNLVTNHVQVLEFTPEDLISSLGGYLGLFIGASIVTLLEFIEHVFIGFLQCFIPTR